MKRTKPKQRTINPNTLKRADIEYLCKTRVIDEMVMKKKGIDFDPTIADELEKETRFYFIVKKNLEYDVVPGNKLEENLNEWGFVFPEQSEKATLCLNHFIKSVHGINEKR